MHVSPGCTCCTACHGANPCGEADAAGQPRPHSVLNPSANPKCQILVPVRAEGLPSWFVAPQSPLISPRSDQHRLDQELKAGRCCRPAPLRAATRCICWAPGVVGRMLAWFDGSTSSLPRARVSQEGGMGSCVPSRVAGLAGCTPACTNTVHRLARGADGGRAGIAQSGLRGRATL